MDENNMGTVDTEKAPAPKGGNPLRQFCSPEKSGLRKILYMVLSTLTLAPVIWLLFVPICYAYYYEGKVQIKYAVDAISAIENLKSEQPTSFVYVELIFFILLSLSLGVILYRLIRSLFLLSDEDALIKKTKGTAIFASVVVGLSTLFICIFSPLNISLGGRSEGEANFGPLIFMAVVVILYALLVGVVNLFREKRREENILEQMAQERRANARRKVLFKKLELLVYAVGSAGLAVAALLSKIMTVTFEMTGYDVSFTLFGWNLMKDSELLASKGERLVAFLIFTLLVLCITALFLAVTSFLSRSVLFNKIAITTVLLGSLTCLMVGLLGQYYRIVQELNLEMIQSVLQENFIYVGDDMSNVISYTIQSSSLVYFLATFPLLVLLFFRRPYSKILELEKVIENEDAALIPQAVNVTSISEGTAEDEYSANNDITDPWLEDAHEEIKEAESEWSMAPAAHDFDPCPAFTELDRKIPAYRAKGQALQTKAFEDLTLPHLVDFIVRYARNSEQHLFYTQESIAAFLAGLGTTKLSILQGMSGTGKTSLPKIVAEALASNCDIVEVESSWRDKNELIGYYNEFNKIYTPKKFTQMLYKASLNPRVLTFIVLDEMNLSRIEYYFSDFLSLMEHKPRQRKLKLLNQSLVRTEEGAAVPYAGLEFGHTLRVPENVWFVGTANRDESTYDISDKVYDRAHTMNFDKRAAKVQYFNEPLTPRYVSPEDLERLFAEARAKVPFSLDQYPVVAEVEKLLAPYNISFGNRVAKQMECFVSIYASCFTVTDAVMRDGLETILLSKVVRKLELKTLEDKEALAEEFAKLHLEKCSEFIRSIKED